MWVTAIASAFEPEWRALGASVVPVREERVAGTRYVLGTLEGRPVLLFLTGMSMVNAAMTIERACGRYPVARIVFSGIAGALDPALAAGDVVVPERWGQPLECTFARGSDAAGYEPPRDGPLASPADLPGFGAIFAREVEVPGADGPARRRWFAADAGLLAAARAAAATVALEGAGALAPRVRISGAGVSGPAFVDNAGYRDHLRAAWGAAIVDMESAAAAQVAHARGLPFVGLRSVSDLAGGEPDANGWERHAPLAARNVAALVRAVLRALPADTK